MTDKQHIRRLKQAIARVQEARRYGTVAARAIRSAEAELRAALAAVMRESSGGGGGERREPAA